MGFGFPSPAGSDAVVVFAVDSEVVLPTAPTVGSDDVPSPKPKATTTSTVMATIAARATTTKFDSDTRWRGRDGGVEGVIGSSALAKRELYSST